MIYFSSLTTNYRQHRSRATNEGQRPTQSPRVFSRKDQIGRTHLRIRSESALCISRKRLQPSSSRITRLIIKDPIQLGILPTLDLDPIPTLVHVDVSLDFPQVTVVVSSTNVSNDFNVGSHRLSKFRNAVEGRVLRIFDRSTVGVDDQDPRDRGVRFTVRMNEVKVSNRTISLNGLFEIREPGA